MLPRVWVILLLLVPTWLGVTLRADQTAPQSEKSASACDQTAAPTSNCGCGGGCGMSGCGCGVRPADPTPDDRAPQAPAPKDGKSLVLGLMRQASRPVLDSPGRTPIGGATAVASPQWSYDSIQSYLCVWRT